MINALGSFVLNFPELDSPSSFFIEGWGIRTILLVGYLFYL